MLLDIFPFFFSFLPGQLAALHGYVKTLRIGDTIEHQAETGRWRDATVQSLGAESIIIKLATGALVTVPHKTDRVLPYVLESFN